MILTEEQFKEFQEHGTVDGQPIDAYEPRKCPQCGTPIGQNNKPHNKRPDKTDMRCTNCVEVEKEAEWLETAARKRRVDILTKQEVEKREKTRRRNRRSYRKR